MRSIIVFFLLFVISVATNDADFSFSVGDVKELTLSTNTLYSFTVPPPTTDASGLIFQLHTQRESIHLSASSLFTYDQTVIGTHVGLWSPISSSTHKFYSIIHSSSNTSQLSILVAVTEIPTDSPIPGGCTLVSAVDTDPNIQLIYSAYTTNVIFQDGNQGYNGSSTPPLCVAGNDDSEYGVRQLKYRIYRKMLKPGDYSHATLFNTLKEIIGNSNKDLPSFDHDYSGVKNVTVDSFLGQGVAYVVKVTSLINGKESFYVPTVTYACTLNSRGECDDGVTVTDIVVAIVFGLTGFWMVFFSHRFFHVEVVLISWIVFTYGFYILDSALLSYDHTALVCIAAGGGLCVSFCIFMFWFFTGWFIPIVFIVNGTTGFIVGAILLYTPLGSYEFFRIGYVYGLLIACFVVLFLIPAVIFPRASNIFSSSFIGGYLVVYSIGIFVWTTIDQIVLKVVRVASIKDYLSFHEAYPFTLNDILLVGGWVVLIILGIIIQSLLVRKRDPFPKKSLYKQIKDKLSNRIDREERRRLLSVGGGHSPTHKDSSYGALLN